MGHNAMIAMSGGVDSSVSAYLMLQNGYTCMGATMRMFDNETIGREDSACCSLDDVEDARAVAYRLGMPFHVINAKKEFTENVIEDFIRTYESGATPNPCIRCNRHLKFDLFLNRARTLGCDCIVMREWFKEHCRRPECLINFTFPISLDVLGSIWPR